MSTGLLDATELQRLVGTRTIGRRIEVYEELGSTNTLALERAGDPANHGLVIFAEKQTAGRGRMSRPWHAPKGAAILCSVLLELDVESTPAQTVLWWSSLAVREAILQAAQVDTIIKWPNDLLVGTKKICGILIESKPVAENRRAYVIGIGINCLQHRQHFPPELRDVATSLDLESDQPVDRLAVAKQLVEELDRFLGQSEQLDRKQLTALWAEHSLPLGRRLGIVSEGQRFCGTLVELDPEGGILMELERGGRRLFSPFTTTIESMSDR